MRRLLHDIAKLAGHFQVALAWHRHHLNLAERATGGPRQPCRHADLITLQASGGKYGSEPR